VLGFLDRQVIRLSEVFQRVLFNNQSEKPAGKPNETKNGVMGFLNMKWAWA
jgi:hypothetical protein